MEKERKVKILSLITLIVAILGLTVAFAALSTALSINGKIKVTGGIWDVHFVSASGAGNSVIVSEKRGRVEATDASLSTTTISGIDVTLTRPGDSASYTFYIENAGTIDAKISTLSMDSPTCDPDTLEGDTGESVCGNLDYKLEYVKEAEPIGDGDASGATGSGNVSVNDKLPSKTKRKVKLTIGYKYEATKIPSSDVVVNIPSITITYGQDGQN